MIQYFSLLFMLGRAKAGQSKPDVISLVPNRGEQPLLWTCCLDNCKCGPVCSWPSLPRFSQPPCTTPSQSVTPQFGHKNTMADHNTGLADIKVHSCHCSPFVLLAFLSEKAIRLMRHSLLLENPFWLFQITSSFIWLYRASRKIFPMIFPGLRAG